MKTYVGLIEEYKVSTRKAINWNVYVRNTDNNTPAMRRLPLYLHEANHSPSGFAWGYGGCGPAQLAYAILRNLWGKDLARDLYWAFKWEYIARLDKNQGFIIVEADLIYTMSEIYKKIKEAEHGGKKKI